MYQPEITHRLYRFSTCSELQNTPNCSQPRSTIDMTREELYRYFESMSKNKTPLF